MKTVTIVLADDHPVVRAGLRTVLESESDFLVVAEAGDGREALHLIEEYKPDVLILDLLMPRMTGISALQQISKRFPAIRVVVLSMQANEAYVLQALHHGAVGYVLKDASVNELVLAVRAAIMGQRYLSPPLSEDAIESYVQKAQEAQLDSYDVLTERECEVLQLAAESCTNAEIAARLFISPRTAETHRTHIMRKLKLNTQTDLIRYALSRGIISLDKESNNFA